MDNQPKGSTLLDELAPILGNVTRLETVDHAPCTHCAGTGLITISGQGQELECPACHGTKIVGRNVIFWSANKHISLDLQDGGRTLKIFISERGDA